MEVRDLEACLSSPSLFFLSACLAFFFLNFSLENGKQGRRDVSISDRRSSLVTIAFGHI